VQKIQSFMIEGLIRTQSIVNGGQTWEPGENISDLPV